MADDNGHRMVELLTEISGKLNKLEGIEKQIEGLSKHVVGLDQRVARLEAGQQNLTEIVQGALSMIGKVSEVATETRLDMIRLETALNKLVSVVTPLAGAVRYVPSLENRIQVLEVRVEALEARG